MLLQGSEGFTPKKKFIHITAKEEIWIILNKSTNKQNIPTFPVLLSKEIMCVNHFIKIVLENRESHLLITQVKKKKKKVIRFYHCQPSRWVIFKL